MQNIYMTEDWNESQSFLAKDLTEKKNGVFETVHSIAIILNVFFGVTFKYISLIPLCSGSACAIKLYVEFELR